jgi:hypothetical protein
VFLIALGPAVLPGLNLMLDVPALALGVLLYALFAAASERKSAPLALASGLALGLAMQTKYSAAVYPALVLTHAALYRRPREALLALVAAAAVAVGWEALLVARYGEAHFLAGFDRLRSATCRRSPGRTRKPPGARRSTDHLSALVAGGTALLPALLACGVAGARRLAVSELRCWQRRARGVAWLPRPPWFAGRAFARLTAHNPSFSIFVPLGVFVAGTVGTVELRGRGRRRREGERGSPTGPCVGHCHRNGRLPDLSHPAVRLIGIGVAAALAARAASPRAPAPAARAGVRIATAFGLALGALYFFADLSDARARRSLAARIVERVPQLGADPQRETVWYSGHWELQYYLAQAGMQPVIAGGSQLRPRDWLILSEGASASPLSFPASRFRQEDELIAVSRSPWSTIPLYYDGPVPLRRQPESQASARIFRVTRDWIPRLQVSPERQDPD